MPDRPSFAFACVWFVDLHLFYLLTTHVLYSCYYYLTGMRCLTCHTPYIDVYLFPFTLLPCWLRSSLPYLPAASAGHLTFLHYLRRVTLQFGYCTHLRLRFTGSYLCLRRTRFGWLPGSVILVVFVFICCSLNDGDLFDICYLPYWFVVVVVICCCYLMIRYLLLPCYCYCTCPLLVIAWLQALVARTRYDWQHLLLLVVVVIACWWWVIS